MCFQEGGKDKSFPKSRLFFFPGIALSSKSIPAFPWEQPASSEFSKLWDTYFHSDTLFSQFLNHQFWSSRSIVLPGCPIRPFSTFAETFLIFSPFVNLISLPLLLLVLPYLDRPKPLTAQQSKTERKINYYKRNSGECLVADIIIYSGITSNFS